MPPPFYDYYFHTHWDHHSYSYTNADGGGDDDDDDDLSGAETEEGSDDEHEAAGGPRAWLAWSRRAA